MVTDLIKFSLDGKQGTKRWLMNVINAATEQYQVRSEQLQSAGSTCSMGQGKLTRN